MIEKTGPSLPFSCEQVFDLVADIERYPEFLTWWITAQIKRRESNVCHVEQVVGVGPVRLQFESTAVLNRPQRIDVTSTDRPFRKYQLSWIVSPSNAVGCRISVAADLELKSVFLQQLVNRLAPGAIDDVIAAFAARAHSLYDSPANASPRHDG